MNKIQKKLEEALTGRFKLAAALQKREQERKAKDEARAAREKQQQPVKTNEAEICPVCEMDPCICETGEHVQESDLHAQLKAFAAARGGKLTTSAERKQATADMIAKREKEAANRPKPTPQPHIEKYPLGGRDEKSGRSYSEEYVAEAAKKQLKPKYEVRVTPTTGMFHIHDAETGKRVAKDVASTRMKAYQVLDQWHKKQGVAEGTKPGWMLKQDPVLAKKIKDAQKLAKKRQASYGNPAAGKPVKEEAADICTVCGQTPCNCTHMNAFSKFRAGLVEKTLTPAEKKKREEVAKAIERENPNMPMSKKMAIATATAKKVAEDTEQIDELKKSTLASYIKKGAQDLSNVKDRAAGEHEYGDPRKGIKLDKKADRRIAGMGKAASRLAEEDVEIDELSKGTLASYAKKGALDSVMRMGQAVEKGDAKGAEKAGRRYGGVVKAVDRLAKEETELEDQHLCAKHVRSQLLGDGIVLEAQHADPDENGQIEWYMVEFNSGIRKVYTEDLEIMIAEYHGNHKKKRMTNG